MFLSTYSLVAKLHRKKRIDLISSHWVYPDASSAVIIAKILNIKVAVHALGCDINDYIKYYLRRQIIKKTLDYADLIVPVSHALKDVIVNTLHVNTKIEVILNGVNQDIFFPVSRTVCREILSMPLDQKALLFVGNFQIEKGLEYLLEALSLVKKSEPDIHLYVIGSGRLQSRIINKIKRFGLSDNVTLIGRVSHHQLPVYFSAANYLCLPSLREGCPNVVLESLSCGTPVIASKVGTNPEVVITGIYGYLHDPMNIIQMASTIVSAFNENYIENMAPFDWFSWESNTDFTYNAYNKIL